MVIAGPSNVVERFTNSIIIAFGSTFLAVFLGTLTAYAFSRFKVPLADDLLFFILSTRFMPPIAVAIPIYLMYRAVGLTDTKLGMILLYTAVNVSLAVWLLKGFIDEIPREYEEAAMIDGYSRLQAFIKVVLPQAATGIAATAIFCLIFAWNEYAFAVLLTSGEAQTMPPFIPFIIGEGGQDWPAVAAGNDPVPDPDLRLHRAPAEASPPRHHLRRGAQMTHHRPENPYSIDATMDAAQELAAETLPVPPSSSMREEPLDQYQVHPAARYFRRGPWENLATVIIAAGVVMLMQPFSLVLYGWSFATILVGTAMFIIVSHFVD